MATANENIPDPSEAPAEESLRDTLGRAFDESAAEEGAEPAKAAAAEPTPPPPKEPGTTPPAPPPGAPGRDNLGRFAPKAPGEAPASPVAPANGAAAPMPPAPPPGELKAPSSWRPEVREQWAAVPEPVRAEIHRREAEHQQLMQRSAAARQFEDAFERTVRPYEMFIRQENSTPLQAVQNLMQTAADLRVGTPQHKAQLVAGMVQNFSIDVRLLDTLLAKQMGADDGGGGGAAGAQPLRDPRLDNLLWQMQQTQAQQQQNEMAAFNQQLTAFGESHEFYRDVGGLMADLTEIDARQGKPAATLEQLYERACKLHEGVSNILAQRAAAATAGNQSAAALRAKRAAQSVKGEPTPHSGATVPKNDSVRAAIEAAIDTLGNA